MILSNRLTFLDCPGCGGRYQATHTEGDAYATPCPACGYAPEATE